MATAENIAIKNQVSAEDNSSRIVQELQPWESVVNGTTSTLKLPVGLTYDTIIIKMGGFATDRSDLKNIKLKVGTTVVMEFKSGKVLKQINDYYGRHEDNSYLSLHFVRREMNTLVQRDSFGMGTLGMQSLTIEADIDLDTPANSPTLKSWAVVSPPRSIGNIISYKRIASVNVPAVGENDVTAIPAKARILAMHWVETTAGNITQMRLLADNQEIYNASRVVAKIIQKQSKSARVPDSSIFTMDWGLTGTPSSAIIVNNVNDLRFKPTVTAAQTDDVYVEYLGTLAQVAS